MLPKALAALTTLALLTPSAFAGIWVFNVQSFVDHPCPAEVQVTVNDVVNPGFVTISVDVISNPVLGDIRGVWLFMGGRPAAMTLADITGADITAKAFDTLNLGGGNNMNPSPLPGSGLFDIGTSIGTPGMGADDIQSTEILVAKVDGIGGDDFLGVGVRLTSVGDATHCRRKSCKLYGELPPSVPEPATLVLLGVGLAGGSFFRRRRSR